ncbi:PQQ-binding-like beta-propeller repeat protein [Streptomyces sp. DSM 44915]|uniref:PQQ-binding-like beta-propeller repeat protein n=1 Tax=Streptomyces chisholmiae TaxID=3075540 RepID=A0ABU2JZ98_9ACTN|nr:PQQ-binding-like beta-propeller repeat protein [Streptomyces sp. DSM 44915]MDT0270333.1 PQQ-binding-like beta-propeller repeat protein [Streptomyces sp. DSM 44915]
MAESEGRIGLAATVGVVLLALLTVWVVVFSREDGVGPDAEPAGETTTPGPPATLELAELWTAPAGAAPVRGQGGRTIRVWAHDGTVTVVTAAGVRGRLAVDGREAWAADPPPGAGPPCAAAGATNAAGLGAVVFTAADGGCSVLGVLDVTDGDLRWWRQLTGPDATPADPAGVAVELGEGTVAVGLDAAGTPAAFHRFAVADATPLPLPAPPDGAAAGCPDDRRQPRTVRQRGSRLLVLSDCPGARRELSAYGADTGEWHWSHAADQETELTAGALLAGDPVVLVRGRDTEAELVAYGESGEELWHRPLGATEAAAGPRPGPLPGEHAVVAGEVLITRYQAPADVRDGPAAEPAASWALAGYELAGGQPRWTTELAPGTQLLGVAELGVPLLAEPTADDRLRILTLDPGTGGTTRLGTVPLHPDRAYDHQFTAFDEHQLYLLTAFEGGTPRLRLAAYER